MILQMHLVVKYFCTLRVGTVNGRTFGEVPQVLSMEVASEAISVAERLHAICERYVGAPHAENALCWQTLDGKGVSICFLICGIKRSIKLSVTLHGFCAVEPRTTHFPHGKLLTAIQCDYRTYSLGPPDAFLLGFSRSEGKQSIDDPTALLAEPDLGLQTSRTHVVICLEGAIELTLDIRQWLRSFVAGLSVSD